jgi:hypothetical protein
VLLLVCTIAWFIRCVWVIAYIGRYYNLPNLPLSSSSLNPTADVERADTFMNAYPVFVAMCVLFGLGIKKQPNGLWSQPSTQNYQGTVPIQTNSQYIPPQQPYVYGGMPMQSTQPGYQYQPVQQQQQMYQQQQPVYQQQPYQPPSVSSTSPAPPSVVQQPQHYYPTQQAHEMASNGRFN